MSRSRSDSELEKWTRLYSKLPRATVNQRLSGFLASLVLGRNFGESAASYYDRKELTEFVTWAREQIAA